MASCFHAQAHDHLRHDCATLATNNWMQNLHFILNLSPYPGRWHIHANRARFDKMLRWDVLSGGPRKPAKYAPIPTRSPSKVDRRAANPLQCEGYFPGAKNN